MTFNKYCSLDTKEVRNHRYKYAREQKTCMRCYNSGFLQRHTNIEICTKLYDYNTTDAHTYAGAHANTHI